MKTQHLIEELRREFFWFKNRRYLYLSFLMIAVLVGVCALHLTTSWNAIAHEWNGFVGDNHLSMRAIKESFDSPMDVQKVGSSTVVGNNIRYQATALLSAYSVLHIKSSIVGGISFLSFAFFPLLYFILGAVVSMREYRDRQIHARFFAASQVGRYLAKIGFLVIVVILSVLAVSLLIPVGMRVARPLMTLNPSHIIPDGLLANFSSQDLHDVKEVVLVLAIAFFIFIVFALCGLCLGEVFKGNNWFILVMALAYYLVPLGNSFDPRNLFASAGQDVFWFGGTFNPYSVNPELISSASSFLVLLLIGTLSVVIAVFCRSYRTSRGSF